MLRSPWHLSPLIAHKVQEKRERVRTAADGSMWQEEGAADAVKSSSGRIRGRGTWTDAPYLVTLAGDTGHVTAHMTIFEGGAPGPTTRRRAGPKPGSPPRPARPPRPCPPSPPARARVGPSAVPLACPLTHRRRRRRPLRRQLGYGPACFRIKASQGSVKRQSPPPAPLLPESHLAKLCVCV